MPHGCACMIMSGGCYVSDKDNTTSFVEVVDGDTRADLYGRLETSKG